MLNGTNVLRSMCQTFWNALKIRETKNSRIRFWITAQNQQYKRKLKIFWMGRISNYGLENFQLSKILHYTNALKWNLFAQIGDAVSFNHCYVFTIRKKNK